MENFISKLSAIPEIQAVVLFGSFARGDVDRRSDIDLLLVVDMDDPGALRARIVKLIGELKPHREISPTLTNLRDLETSFLGTVFREGIVLHGKMLLNPDHLALQPRVLLAYDLAGLSPSHKVQISRSVHGFKSRKKVRGKLRTYEYPGLKSQYGAVSISRSVLLLRPEDSEKFTQELDKRKIPYTKRDVYL